MMACALFSVLSKLRNLNNNCRLLFCKILGGYKEKVRHLDKAFVQSGRNDLFFLNIIQLFGSVGHL